MNDILANIKIICTEIYYLALNINDVTKIRDDSDLAGTVYIPCPKKEDTSLLAETLSNLSRFLIFFTGRFSRKFAIKTLL